jgi:hypothetical protein
MPMTSPRFSIFGRILLVASCATVLIDGKGRAGDFAGKDFSLRLPAALEYFEPYADVAASGGASAASLFGSSNNPAAMPWLFPDGPDGTHFKADLSGQYSNVHFDNGTQLNFTSASFTMGTHDTGLFRLDLGLVTSNEATVLNLPAAFDFELGGFRLNYAKMLADNFSLGGSAGYGRSETEFKAAPGFDFADAVKNIWNFRFGGMWRPEGTQWLLGLNTTYIYGPTDTTTITPTPVGLLRQSLSDPTHQFTVQPGIAYEYAKNALAHLDYEMVYLSNSTGSLTENRFMAGTDIKIFEFFYLRGGGYVDTRGDTGWTAGLGFYPSKHLFIDLAYQNNNFPEIASEFGRSRTLNASVNVQW